MGEVKKNAKIITITIVVILLLEVLLWFCVIKKPKSNDSMIPQRTETQIVYDTIPYPVAKDSIVVKYITQILPVVDDKEDITIADTIRDSIKVEIPIVQKVYKDSNYIAYISGYNPCLDSLIIAKQTTTIYNQKPKHWGIGIQAGLGLNINHPFLVTPYIGIGISYNILNF